MQNKKQNGGKEKRNDPTSRETKGSVRAATVIMMCIESLQ